MKRNITSLLTLLAIVLLLFGVSLLLNRPQPSKAGPKDDLRIIYLPLHSHQQIIPLTGPWVPPLAYTNAVALTDLPTTIKKQKFFDLLLPAILISKEKLNRRRVNVADLLKKKSLTNEEAQWLSQQMKTFKAQSDKELLSKMTPHPTSIILAQAVIETGWGESRFFQNNNNIFGVWSFNVAEPRIKTKETRQGKEVYVKKYSSFIESVDDYFLTIARGPYTKFRLARRVHTNPLRMIPHLLYYSEQREAYVLRLAHVIKANDLKRFDTYRLDPA